MRARRLPALLILAVPATGTAQARTVGHGTPGSCTSTAVVAAVAKGGAIRFACGRKPITITLTETARLRNTSRSVVIDGGGRVTLSGDGKRRILYMDTCDPAQTFTTSHCQDQATPRLTVRRLRLVDGDATGQDFDGGGGGAIFARGGRLRIERSTFARNRCAPTGPDLAGGAVRALSQSGGRPVVVTRSRFTGNACSNGGALGSIGVSWDIRRTRFSGNRALGNGANPARDGTPGGGSGGAIYNDGDRFTLALSRSRITGNRANEGGGAIFFVSNDRTGTLRLRRSVLARNPNAGFHTSGLPGIFYLGAGPADTAGSSLKP